MNRNTSGNVILVEGSAGTGKSYLVAYLSLRVLELIEAKKVAQGRKIIF